MISFSLGVVSERDRRHWPYADLVSVKLNRRFGEWLWEDPERTADLVRTYNERFNSLVPRSYDGARPTLPAP